jgi:hypothetical protein
MPNNTFDIVMTCEGVIDPVGDTDEERREHLVSCWQFLIDTGMAWRLQGWFGRTANALIENGICTR